MKVLFWIATFIPHKQIVENIQNDFGISVAVSTIKYYSTDEDHKKTIMQIRERWGNDIMHVELAHKRRRLEELSKIYDQCMESKQMKNALSAIYQIQGEVEKAQNIGTQMNYQINIYKDMSETELEEERLKSLERLKTLKQIPEIKAEEIEDAV